MHLERKGGCTIYEQFFSLKETPFSVQPDPKFAYPSNEHKIAIAKMRYAADQKRGLAVLTGPVGSGKCLARGTPVLMFDGSIKPVEDVQVGDLLMGPDSTPRTVQSLARGYDRMYQVIPVKGEPYTVNEAHILSLKQTGWEGRVQGRVLNLSIRDYLARSTAFKRNVKGYRVGVEFPERPVTLEPYFLGLWLGDGSSDGPRIATTDSAVVLYLYHYARQCGVALRRVTIKGDRCPAYDLTVGRSPRKGIEHLGQNPIRTALQEYRLLGNKHIPHVYKANSRVVRLELLAGLLDSDGSLQGGGYDIVCKHERLADDIVFLARSLGFAAYKKPARKTCANNGVTRTYYRIGISGDVSQIPSRLERKSAPPRKQPEDVLLTGITVEEAGNGEYFGFEIDGDRLFLLGDFTVTHNTTTAHTLLATWEEDPKKTVAFLPSASVRLPAAFLRLILEGFGVQPTRTEADNRRFLERFLLDEFKEGRHPILLLDEGQNVSPKNIDTIADLTNFQTAKTKLITVVMLAQDNLPNKLERKDAFRSRIAVVGHLDPLSFEDTCGMIAHRLKTAGGGPLESYFKEEALIEIYNTTKGIPRDICILCDAVFVNGYVHDQRLIDAALVERTVGEMARAKKWPVNVKGEGRDTK